MSICKALSVLLTLSASMPAVADEAPPAYSTYPADLALLDYPNNLKSSARPSMQQAVRLSKSAYQTLHWGLGHWLHPNDDQFGRRFLSTLGYLAADSVLGYVPGFDGWTHEEFHRAVMGYRGTASYDEINDLPFGASMVSVSHERDEDFIRLKRDHPADMVRLPAAGIEGQSQLVLALEKDQFFANVRNYHQMLYLVEYLNSYFYVASGSTKEADDLTDDMNDGEDTVEERDFVGHDFTSWVYDLHRPDEPYEARGAHPSGNGINRYRRMSDLTDGEREYLAAMGRLQLLNLVDPFVWGTGKGWTIPDGRATFALQHYLTSFGYTQNANVFAKWRGRDWFFTLLNYHNAKQSTYGVDLQLLREPLNLGAALPHQISARAHAWQQPKDQMFRDGAARTGGLAAVTLYWPVRPSLDWYLELEGKSAGWVAGTPYLDENGTARVGVEAWLF